jgi:hypothetical protein
MENNVTPCNALFKSNIPQHEKAVSLRFHSAVLCHDLISSSPAKSTSAKLKGKRKLIFEEQKISLKAF